MAMCGDAPAAHECKVRALSLHKQLHEDIENLSLVSVPLLLETSKARHHEISYLAQAAQALRPSSPEQAPLPSPPTFNYEDLFATPKRQATQATTFLANQFSSSAQTTNLWAPASPTKSLFQPSVLQQATGLWEQHWDALAALVVAGRCRQACRQVKSGQPDLLAC
jgi:hypothetical protein